MCVLFLCVCCCCYCLSVAAEPGVTVNIRVGVNVAVPGYRVTTAVVNTHVANGDPDYSGATSQSLPGCQHVAEMTALAPGETVNITFGIDPDSSPLGLLSLDPGDARYIEVGVGWSDWADPNYAFAHTVLTVPVTPSSLQIDSASVVFDPTGGFAPGVPRPFSFALNPPCVGSRLPDLCVGVRVRVPQRNAVTPVATIVSVAGATPSVSGGVVPVYTVDDATGDVVTQTTIPGAFVMSEIIVATTLGDMPLNASIAAGSYVGRESVVRGPYRVSVVALPGACTLAPVPVSLFASPYTQVCDSS